MNPIELWWADLKRALRTLAIDVEAELRRAARRLRSALSADKVAGWFTHALGFLQIN